MECTVAEDIEVATTVAFSPLEVRETIFASSGPITIHRPVAQESKGEVVLLPGWSGPRSGPADVLVFIASKLAENGWTAIRLDLPGRGDASANAPVNLDAMIAAASEYPVSESAQRKVLLGICSGGNVALGAASLKSCASFDSVIAISTFPFQPARTWLYDYLRRWNNLKRYTVKSLSPSTWLRLIKGDINVGRVKKNIASSEKSATGPNLKDSARNIERELRNWKGKALFIWGGGDEEAPPAQTHFKKRHAAGMGQKSAVRFHTVPGANHNFYGKAWREELVREILEFLRQI